MASPYPPPQLLSELPPVRLLLVPSYSCSFLQLLQQWNCEHCPITDDVSVGLGSKCCESWSLVTLIISLESPASFPTWSNWTPGGDCLTAQLVSLTKSKKCGCWTDDIITKSISNLWTYEHPYAQTCLVHRLSWSDRLVLIG